MRTTIAKRCLYCGLRLPEHADFCPECGRPLEVAIRVDSDVKMMRTIVVKGCLYCDLRLPDTAEFCPQCGRPIERGFRIRPIRESEADCPDTEIEGKDDLERQQVASSEGSEPHGHDITRKHDEHEYVNLICTLTTVASSA